jgi:Transglycosylase-like domain
VTPFRGGSLWWAIPFSIVVCESGARGYVPSGYYGILFTAATPTWQTWGEPHFAPTPGQASKREQDIVAHRLYVAYGLQPWECAGIVGLR